jgi:hypothetical protein
MRIATLAYPKPGGILRGRRVKSGGGALRIAGANLAELVGGLLTAAIGVFAVAQGAAYTLGSLTRIGPGFFPAVVGAAMIVLGFAIVLEGLRADAPPIEKPAILSLLAVLGGIAAFALLIERAGLVPAAAALVMISSLASPRPRLLPILALAAAVSAFSVLVFAVGLGLSLKPFAL